MSIERFRKNLSDKNYLLNRNKFIDKYLTNVLKGRIIKSYGNVPILIT